MDSSKYMEKSLRILERDKFIKINDDLPEHIESKNQRCARKIDIQNYTRQEILWN